jgi:hypothetical protein
MRTWKMTARFVFQALAWPIPHRCKQGFLGGQARNPGSEWRPPAVATGPAERFAVPMSAAEEFQRHAVERLRLLDGDGMAACITSPASSAIWRPE